jgi:hypothetical protein
MPYINDACFRSGLTTFLPLLSVYEMSTLCTPFPMKCTPNVLQRLIAMMGLCLQILAFAVRSRICTCRCYAPFALQDFHIPDVLDFCEGWSHPRLRKYPRILMEHICCLLLFIV